MSDRSWHGGDRSPAERWVAGTLVGLIILFGAWLRVVDLGQADFHGDELDLVYAAESLARGEPPLLPSGTPYERALDFTRMVELSVTSFGTSEATARLPAAFFGIASLAVVVILTWVVAGPWAAVWACLLLAVYPEALKESRRARFYTYQLFFVLLAMLCGWYALRRALSDRGLSGRGPKSNLGRQWLAIAGLALAFLLAARVQVTTLSVVAGWFVCCGAIGILELQRLGKRAWTVSVPLQVAALVVAAGLALFIARPDVVERLWLQSRYVPLWVGGEPGSARTYFWHLLDVYPLLSFVAPLAFLFVTTRDRVLGLLLLAWFCVPLGLHSFAFAWKGARFVLTAMPAMLIALAILAASACGVIHGVVGRAPWLQAHDRLRRTVATLAVGVLATAGTLGSRSFRASAAIPPSYQVLGWAAAQEIMDSLAIGPSVPRGTSMPLPALYYWSDVDFAVGTDYPRVRSPGQGPGEFQTSPDNGDPRREHYGGLPVLTEPEQILAAYRTADTVVVAVDLGKWREGNIAAALKKTLEEEAAEMCRGQCFDLRLYVWPLRVEPGSSRSGS